MRPIRGGGSSSDFYKLIADSDKSVHLNRLFLETISKGHELIFKIDSALNTEDISDFQYGLLLGEVKAYSERYGYKSDNILNTENISNPKYELRAQREGIGEFLNEIGDTFVQRWQEVITPLKTVFSQLGELFSDSFDELMSMRHKLLDGHISKEKLAEAKFKTVKKYGGLMALVAGDVKRVPLLVDAHAEAMGKLMISMKLDDGYIKFDFPSNVKSILDRAIEKQGSNWLFNDYGGYDIVGTKPNASSVSFNVTYKFYNKAFKFGSSDSHTFGNKVVEDMKEIKRMAYNSTIDIPSNVNIGGDTKDLIKAIDTMLANKDKFKSIYWKVYGNFIMGNAKAKVQEISNALHALWPNTWGSETVARITIAHNILSSMSALCNSSVTTLNDSLDFFKSYSKALLS